MEKETIEPYYNNQAKEVIDTMFDAKIFKDHVTRDDMNGFQELIGYILQSSARTTHKLAVWKAEWDVAHKGDKMGS